MQISRVIPCGLNIEQINVVFNDICHGINYESEVNKPIAELTPHGLKSLPWGDIPDYVESAEIIVENDELKLIVTTEDEMPEAGLTSVADMLLSELTQLFGYKTRHYEQKVFCIGWPKTGTTSLTNAFRTLGLFSWHFSPWMIGCTSFASEFENTKINFSAIADYTAVSDLPVCALYKELDQAFPNSKFILTTRSEDSWLKSAVADIEAAREKHGMIHAAVRWAYGVEEVNEAIYIQRYQEHNQQVLDYFKNRDDFLLFDLTEKEPWQTLCGFLNLPVPDVAFPHFNKTIK